MDIAPRIVSTRYDFKILYINLLVVCSGVYTTLSNIYGTSTKIAKWYLFSRTSKYLIGNMVCLAVFSWIQTDGFKLISDLLLFEAVALNFQINYASQEILPQEKFGFFFFDTCFTAPYFSLFHMDILGNKFYLLI